MPLTVTSFLYFRQPVEASGQAPPASRFLVLFLCWTTKTGQAGERWRSGDGDQGELIDRAHRLVVHHEVRDQGHLSRDRLPGVEAERAHEGVRSASDGGM